MSPRAILILLAFGFFVFLVFYGIGDYQLEFYDESRRGVSALEMYQGKSHPLVPTYAGSPEHWGTKPPLLIWLQTFFIAIFGAGEWAIRLPSALATLAAIGLMIWFTHRHWKNPLTGVLAGAILLTNWNFLGNHGARSGDFDALLLLFTLGQVIFYYHWTRTGRSRDLLLAAGSLFLAGWTKGIAGCLFLPALGIWTLLDTTARKQLLNWRLYLSFGLALMGILSYYFLRETVDPGYLELVWNNELGGRYIETSEGHIQPWYHYLEVLYNDRVFFSFVPIGLVGGIVLCFRKEEKGAASLLLIAALSFLFVISYSATKLFWYVNPMLPYLSLLAAAMIVLLSKGLRSMLPERPAWAYPASVTLLILALCASGSYRQARKALFAGDYLGMQTSLSYREGITNPDLPVPFTVLTWHYHANARFYVEKERVAGREINIQPIKRIVPPFVTDTIPATTELRLGQRVMLCENRTWVWMAEAYHYWEIAEAPPCKIVEIREPRIALPIE